MSRSPLAESAREIIAIQVENLYYLAEKAYKQRDEALAAIERVRALHLATGVEGNHDQANLICGACYEAYPCTTISALDGEQE